MTIMTKRGSLDNIVTYEHICDTTADMSAIDPKYVTLGSVCIVVKGEADGLEVYMANTQKEWVSLLDTGGEASPAISFYICSTDEIGDDGLPNIESPDTTTFYLVPGEDIQNNMYNEYFWNEEEEKFELFSESHAEIVYAEATTEAAGLMSAADKTKLDDIEFMSDSDFTSMYNKIFGGAN